MASKATARVMTQRLMNEAWKRHPGLNLSGSDEDARSNAVTLPVLGWDCSSDLSSRILSKMLLSVG